MVPIVLALLLGLTISVNPLHAVNATSQVEIFVGPSITIVDEELDIICHTTEENILVVNIYSMNGPLILSHTGCDGSSCNFSIASVNDPLFVVEVITSTSSYKQTCMK